MRQGDKQGVWDMEDCWAARRSLPAGDQECPEALRLVHGPSPTSPSSKELAHSQWGCGLASDTPRPMQDSSPLSLTPV